ncbi:sugar porter family MFS transporter [Rhodococcus aerolatus]
MANETASGSSPSRGSSHDADVAHAVLFSGAAAIGGFLFGYDTSVINGAVTAIEQRFSASATATGLTVSLALLGAAAGAWVAGSLADRLGRIRVMQIAAVMFGVSAVGSGLPFSIVDLALWRILGGVAVGVASVISPAYIAEIAPAAYRGRLGSMHQLAIVLGIAVSALVNYAIASAAGGSASNDLLGLQAWQWMLIVCVVPAALYLVMSLTIPESPRYLVRQGRDDKAAAVLAEVEGGDHDAVAARIEEIRRSLNMDAKSSIKDVLGGRFGFIPLVWLGIALAALQQFVGINVIFYYSSALWQSVGIGEDQSLLISVVSAVVNIGGTLVGIAVIDRFGRRPLLMVGSVGMAAALGTAAWAFSYANPDMPDAPLPDPQGTIALVGANAFVFFFALSWGPVVWVLLSEVFPNRLRAAAVGVATAANWIANFLVSVSFPRFSAANLSLTYVGYAVMALISLVVVLKFVPETNGRTLEDAG